MKPIVETVDLNTVNQIQISVNEFRGRVRLDVRHYYRDGPFADWKPTKKGINLGKEDIDAFRKALDRIFSKVELGADEGQVG